jgi:integrase
MYFNDFQIATIKEYLKKENPLLWLACLMQYYCFIRPNELRQLKIEYVNLSAGCIEVPGNVSKNRKTQKVSIPTSFLPELLFLSSFDPELFIFGGPGSAAPSRDYLSKAHKKMLDTLKIKGRYGFYSWKHTGVVKAWRAGINIKDLQMQLRHHSLDMVNEYLKNLGVMDSDRIRDLFPAI